jgi:hypothetical protein
MVVVDHIASEPLVITGPWVWSNQTNPSSSSKQIRSDTGNWVSATVINVSTTDNNNVNRTADLSYLKNGDKIILEGAGVSVTFLVASSIAQSGYYALSIILINQTGAAPASGTVLTVTMLITITGNASKISAEFFPGTVNNITPIIGEDLIRLMANALQTVSHLIAHADFNVHMASGPIVRYSFDITTATAGEEFPT